MSNINETNLDSRGKMGLWSAVALVFSGMVGSGILFLPHTMAKYGTWGLLSWVLGAVMTYCMFLSFSRTSEYFSIKRPDVKDPDILDFLRLRYCDNTSFLFSYGHFAAMTVTGAVTSLALADYFIGLFPNSPLCNKSIASLSLLLVFAVNLISFGAANLLNFWLTLAKLIFFLLISVLGGTYASSYVPVFGSYTLFFSGAAATMFAFMGIELGILASGSIENPKENVIKATLYGLIGATVVFIGVYAAALFMLPNLYATKTPVYDCAIILFGNIGAKIVGAVAVFSCLTGLNSCLVVQGNSLRNFAKKRFITRMFDAETVQGFPWKGALFSLLISFCIIWNPYKIDLQICAVTFIGLLYLGMISLEVILNGFSIVSVLALISCGIMLCNSFDIRVIAISAFVYFIGYIFKYVSGDNSNYNELNKQEVK